MTDSPQSIFHDPLADTPNSQDSQRVTPLPASELQDVELFIAPTNIDDVVRESLARKTLTTQNLGRNQKVDAPEDEIVYVIYGPDGIRVESIEETPEERDEPVVVVDYLKMISDNLPPSKSKGRSRRRNRNRNR